MLFLCTGNSARSQIAEALIERMSDGEVLPASAGSHPTPLHPNAVRAMRERGFHLAGRRSKHLDEFTGEPLDHVIRLCDPVELFQPAGGLAPGQPARSELRLRSIIKMRSMLGHRCLVASPWQAEA